MWQPACQFPFQQTESNSRNAEKLANLREKSVSGEPRKKTRSRGISVRSIASTGNTLKRGHGPTCILLPVYVTFGHKKISRRRRPQSNSAGRPLLDFLSSPGMTTLTGQPVPFSSRAKRPRGNDSKRITDDGKETSFVLR